MKSFVIAIDGNSSTGKSSLAKELAANLNYKHIDSGAMYRAVTLAAINEGFFKDGDLVESLLFDKLSSLKIDFKKIKEDGPNQIHLNDKPVESEIRSLKVSNLVSKVAKLAPVRHYLVYLQRLLGKEGGGVVMDGRDIGTTVFPNAELKIFLTADPKIRAKRRYDELKEKGEQVALEEICENLKERDFLDTTRAISPLTKAKDAIEIDNTNLSREETIAKVKELIRNK